jgi:excisionase family DNA binding protein
MARGPELSAFSNSIRSYQPAENLVALFRLVMRGFDTLGTMTREERHAWMTLAEAASYLRVSKPTVYRLCSAKQLRYYKLAGTGARRFRKADLDALMTPGVPPPKAQRRRKSTERPRTTRRPQKVGSQ